MADLSKWTVDHTTAGTVGDQSSFFEQTSAMTQCMTQCINSMTACQLL